MEDSLLYECSINRLSLERAEKLVPPEFVQAYRWFQERAGEHFDTLPMGDHAPNLPIKLAREAGIHSPDYRNLPSKGAGKTKYVLSVHSQGQTRYDDKDVINREDGTWILDYCAHKTEKGKQPQYSFNQNMMNCLYDGVPIAVMVMNPQGGYTNLGLAYIEEYNAATDVFTLHGPVTADNEDRGFFSFLQMQDLTPEEQKAIEEWDQEDERVRAIVEQVRREQQGAFRKMVSEAYGGACAVTEIDVPQVLQAAHIDRYRGKKSQVVNNGLFLRMDIHKLYDEHLLSVDPDGCILRTSGRLSLTPYAKYDGCKLQVPSDARNKPDEYLLDMHYRQFLTANAS